jgi:hypothetical protein
MDYRGYALFGIFRAEVKGDTPSSGIIRGTSTLSLIYSVSRLLVFR